jgi:hypothetical protein
LGGDLVLDYFAKESNFLLMRSRMQAGLAKAAYPDVPARHAKTAVPSRRDMGARCQQSVGIASVAPPQFGLASTSKTGSHLWSKQRACFIASASVIRPNRHHTDAIPVA